MRDFTNIQLSDTDRKKAFRFIQVGSKVKFPYDILLLDTISVIIPSETHENQPLVQRMKNDGVFVPPGLSQLKDGIDGTLVLPRSPLTRSRLMALLRNDCTNQGKDEVVLRGMANEAVRAYNSAITEDNRRQFKRAIEECIDSGSFSGQTFEVSFDEHGTPAVK